jgi:hypothetical protein
MRAKAEVEELLRHMDDALVGAMQDPDAQAPEFSVVGLHVHAIKILRWIIGHPDPAIDKLISDLRNVDATLNRSSRTQ